MLLDELFADEFDLYLLFPLPIIELVELGRLEFECVLFRNELGLNLVLELWPLVADEEPPFESLK